MKMLAPFGLKYSRPQCVFLPRNLCIMRGEIDYVASNRSIDPRGVRSTPPMECLISGTGWMAGIGHDQTHHSSGPTSALGHSRHFDGVPVTSAHPPITDMFGRNRRK